MKMMSLLHPCQFAKPPERDPGPLKKHCSQVVVSTWKGKPNFTGDNKPIYYSNMNRKHSKHCAYRNMGVTDICYEPTCYSKMVRFRAKQLK